MGPGKRARSKLKEFRADKGLVHYSGLVYMPDNDEEKHLIPALYHGAIPAGRPGLLLAADARFHISLCWWVWDLPEDEASPPEIIWSPAASRDTCGPLAGSHHRLHWTPARVARS